MQCVHGTRGVKCGGPGLKPFLSGFLIPRAEARGFYRHRAARDRGVVGTLRDRHVVGTVCDPSALFSCRVRFPSHSPDTATGLFSS